MSNTSSTTPLARPGQSLDTHKTGVVENTEMLVPASKTVGTGLSLSSVTTTVARLHDLGKLTPAFQDYIREDGRRPPTEMERHSDVGAFVTLACLGEIAEDPAVPLAGFLAVRYHHLELPNVTAEIPALCRYDIQSGYYERLHRQFESIDETYRAQATQLVNEAAGACIWSDLVLDGPRQYCAILERCWRAVEIDQDFYHLVTRLWSTLTCADKLDAAEVPLKSTTDRPDPDSISFDQSTTGVQGDLDSLREQAQDNAIERARELHGQESVFELTLPTGFGKTVAGLQAGLEIAESTDGRVVYALPFTTIIDQVHDDVVSQFGVEPTGDAYTIHHHLAETRTSVSETGVTQQAEALYGETWQAGLVLTTFVQLFESLAGPANLQSIKLPALQDAVVIVDEPQALTPRWWHLVSRLVSLLTEEYDATVILMTATQPRFLESSATDLSPTPLVTPTADYFGFLSDNPRVKFRVEESLWRTIKDKSHHTTTVDVAGKHLATAARDPVNHVLSVSNTVTSTAGLSRALKATLREEGAPPVSLGHQLRSFAGRYASDILAALDGDAPFQPVVTDFLDAVAADTDESTPVTATLTSALRPCDRALLVESLRRVVGKEPTPLDTNPLVVLSTQLVEAGVDISFDRVYRDFAPVASIVQAAGRCNRAFEAEMGTVHLWHLEYDGQSPAATIYGQRSRGRDRLTPTTTALAPYLEEDPTISEQTMLTDVVDAYYQHLHEGDYTTVNTDTLAGAVDVADVKRLGEASLIDEWGEDALVILSNADLNRLDRYLAARETGDYESSKEAFNRLKHILASVPESRLDAIDDTTAILRDLGYSDVAVDGFGIVDVRGDDRYSLSDGLGLRKE